MFASTNFLLAGSSSQGSMSWQTNYGNTTTIASPNVVTANTQDNTNGFGYFSSPFPDSGNYYVDITLESGYDSNPTSVNFLGVSNTVSQFTFGAPLNYKAWYWAAQWYGAGTEYVAPPTTLDADTYRIAINRSNNRLYIKRSTNSTVAQANLPSGTTFYVCVLPQLNYRTSGATIVNGLWYAGSGGLY